MIPVNVLLHPLVGGTPVTLPSDKIRQVYAAAGVAINIQQGQSIAQPVGDIFEQGSVASLLKELVPQAAEDTIHLLIGDRRTVNGEIISGELLDTNSRRLAIVYTQSNYIVDNGDLALAETCIHELGHALNLTHNSVVIKTKPYHYHSAMEQSGDRALADDIPQAWVLCADEGASLAAASQGVDPLIFGAPAPESGCLPFAWVARKQVQSSFAAGNLFPGPGHNFSGVNVEDEMRTSNAVHLLPEHERYFRWGVLSLGVHIKLPPAYRNRAPALFGPQYGNLNLEIRRPDGKQYTHRPRTLCCVDKQDAPIRVRSTNAPFCTFRGPNGAVFDQIGTYKIRVSMPGLGVRSKWVEIEVEPRKQFSILANKAIRRQLATGDVLSGRTRSAIRNAVERESKLELHTRAYLALALSRGRCNPNEKEHLLRIAAHKLAPREIRLASLHARIKGKMREVARTQRKAVLDMVNRALPESADDGTFEQIMGDVRYGLQDW